MEVYNSFIDFYDGALKYADPRVMHWPLISSPLPTIAIVAFYFMFVILIGPKLMANRCVRCVT